MVLEELISPFKAKNKPWRLFFLGFLYATAGLFLGNWIFAEHAGLTMVFLTVLACLPLLYNTFKEEEAWNIKLKGGKGIMKEHSKVLMFCLVLFLGMTIAYVLWYAVLPVEYVQNIFSIQSATIQAINIKISGNYATFNNFSNILLNNLKVLIFCLLFSFLYGAGAMFILTWNASVIATAIGNFIRTNLTSYSTSFGFQDMAQYLQIISLGFIRYLLHGIPEVAAYFVGAIAGGLISVAIIKEKFGTRNFEKVALDSANLTLISIALLVIAAIIEVYISSVLF